MGRKKILHPKQLMAVRMEPYLLNELIAYTLYHDRTYSEVIRQAVHTFLYNQKKLGNY